MEAIISYSISETFHEPVWVVLEANFLIYRNEIIDIPKVHLGRGRSYRDL